MVTRYQARILTFVRQCGFSISKTNKFLEKNEAKLKDLAQPLRIAITGNSVSPSIFEVLEILGSDEVKQRIKNLINKSKEI